MLVLFVTTFLQDHINLNSETCSSLKWFCVDRLLFHMFSGRSQAWINFFLCFQGSYLLKNNFSFPIFYAFRYLRNLLFYVSSHRGQIFSAFYLSHNRMPTCNSEFIRDNFSFNIPLYLGIHIITLPLLDLWSWNYYTTYHSWEDEPGLYKKPNLASHGEIAGKQHSSVISSSSFCLVSLLRLFPWLPGLSLIIDNNLLTK